jgi:hypothetical protein
MQAFQWRRAYDREDLFGEGGWRVMNVGDIEKAVKYDAAEFRKFVEDAPDTNWEGNWATLETMLLCAVAEAERLREENANLQKAIKLYAPGWQLKCGSKEIDPAVYAHLIDCAVCYTVHKPPACKETPQ